MDKHVLIEDIIRLLKDCLHDLCELNAEETYEDYQFQLDLLLSLIHKLPRDIPITDNEAYSLTRFLPVNYVYLEDALNLYVYPLLSKAEIYRRNIIEGDYENLLYCFEDIFKIKPKNDDD